jgi:lipid-binding SYLF domain-containing protein
MTEKALAYLDKTGGFQLGAGPSLTVVDEGFAKTITTTTVRSDVCAFTYAAEGLMGGLGLRGSKITRFHPE